MKHSSKCHTLKTFIYLFICLFIYLFIVSLFVCLFVCLFMQCILTLNSSSKYLCALCLLSNQITFDLKNKIKNHGKSLYLGEILIQFFLHIMFQ